MAIRWFVLVLAFASGCASAPPTHITGSDPRNDDPSRPFKGEQHWFHSITWPEMTQVIEAAAKEIQLGDAAHGPGHIYAWSDGTRLNGYGTMISGEEGSPVLLLLDGPRTRELLAVLTRNYEGRIAKLQKDEAVREQARVERMRAARMARTALVDGLQFEVQESWPAWRFDPRHIGDSKRAKDGVARYLVVTMLVANRGRVPLTIQRPTLIDSKGAIYEQAADSILADDAVTGLDRINPNEIRAVSVVFAVGVPVQSSDYSVVVGCIGEEPKQIHLR